MNSSSSLRLDDDLARMLAAYDQGIGNPDSDAPTLNVSELPPEVRQFLEQSNEAPESLGFNLESPSTGSAGVTASGLSIPIPPPPPPSITHRVGRFELRRQLGKGGCGIVFLAYDPKLQREVAIKIPRPEMLLSTDARRRLFREALAAAEFDHPNLVPVYETGEIGPVCFIASAFCPGETLADWIARQSFPVPPRQAARLVAILAEAVQHAHHRGVLHRDLKPNNILLQVVKTDPADQESPPGSCVLRGETFLPRVVDFGLAKVAERGPSETGTRQILGTPKYMAPEQAQGKHGDIGPTTDVYALGVILYELLTGRAPFEGESDLEVLRQSIQGWLTPPRNLRADLPRDLEAICLKAMARSPAKRYPSAVELSDDIRRFLDARPTLARPLGRTARTMKWLRRNDQAVALFVVTSLALFFLIVGGLSGYQSRRFKDDRDTVLRQQATSRLQDRDREYAHRVHSAFLSWRSGDSRQMEESLSVARSLASAAVESPCFPLEFLERLGMDDTQSVGSPHGSITAFAASPAGDRWATGHADGTLVLWIAKTGQPVFSVRVAKTPLFHVSFFEQGRSLLTAGTGEGARVWGITADAKLAEAAPLATAGEVTCLATTTDRAALFLGTSRGLCLALPAKPGAAVRSWQLAANEPVLALALAADGKTLASASPNHPVRLWRTDTGTLDKEFSPSATANLLVFVPHAPEGWLLATARKGDGAIRLFTPTGREAGALTGHADAVTALAASPDGRALASAALDNSVCIWDTANGTLLRMLRGHTQPVVSMAFSADGNTLYTASEEGTIKTWDMRFDAEGVRVHDQPSPVMTAHVSPDGMQYAVAYADGSVAIYNANTPAVRRFAPSQDRPALARIRFRQNHPPVGLEVNTRRVTVWEFGDTPRPVFRVEAAVGSSFSMAELTEDGNEVAIGEERGQVAIWSIANKKRLATFSSGNDGPVRDLVFAPDGKWLATKTAQQLIGVWDVSEPNPVFRMPSQGDGFCVMEFLPTGERIALAGRGTSIKVCELDGRERFQLIGHIGRVTGLAASPDGRTLVSGSSTGEVKFWDLRTGLEVMGLRRHAGPVTVIEFSANGRVLLTGGSSRNGKGEFAIWNCGKN